MKTGVRLESLTYDGNVRLESPTDADCRKARRVCAPAGVRTLKSQTSISIGCLRGAPLRIGRDSTISSGSFDQLRNRMSVFFDPFVLIHLAADVMNIVSIVGHLEHQCQSAIRRPC